jgi:putative addiction module killer protein
MVSRTSRRSCALSPGCVWPETGNLGDWKPVGNKVSEMRIAFGPGYRLYFTKHQNILIVMLAGGDKSTQARDIKRAQKILQQLELE